MKINTLIFENINSLKGKFQIDFTDPDLSGPGIFAIAGRTGSGKTTILDAISLALFASTARLKRDINQGSNELMTRGTAFCRAEVEFEAVIDGRRLTFRSYWEQHRARNRPDGKLQPAMMGLTQVSTRQQGDEYDCKQVTKVPAMVETITGLDFSRFSRTCLLAQGQFAAFLEADDRDRAEILEQITGTEVYAQISQAVFERDKSERAKIDLLEAQLKGVVLFSDSDYLALEESVAQQKENCQKLEGQKATIQDLITWVRNLANLRSTALRLQEEQRQLQLEREAKGPELHQLAEGRRAEVLRVPLGRRDDLRQKQKTAEMALMLTQNALPVTETACNDAAQGYQVIHEASVSLAKHAEGERALLKEVRTCDQGLQTHTATLKTNRETQARLQNQISVAKTRAEELMKEIALQQKRVKTLAEYQIKSACDERLGTDLKLIDNLVSRRTELGLQIKTLETELANAQKLKAAQELKAKAAESAWNTAQKNLQDEETKAAKAIEALNSGFPGKSAQTLSQAIQGVQGEVAAWSLLESLSTDIIANEQEARQAREADTKREKEIEEAEKRVAECAAARDKLVESREQCLEEKAQFKARASFDEQRQQLREGEACPLCGALEHPYVTDAEQIPDALKKNEARLKALTADLKVAEKALGEATKEHADLGGEKKADQKALKTLEKKRADLQEKWVTQAKALSFAEGPDSLPVIQNGASGAKKKLEAAEKEFVEYQNLLHAQTTASNSLAQARTILQESDKKLVEVRGSVTNSETAITAKESQHAQLLSAQNSHDQELRHNLTGYGFLELDDETLLKLKDRWKTWQENVKNLEKATLAEQKARGNLEANEVEINGLTVQLAERSAEAIGVQKLTDELVKKRRELFGEKNPDEEEKGLEARLAAQKKAETEAAERLTNAKVALEGLRATEVQQKKVLESLLAEHVVAEQAVLAGLQAAGFADEALARQFMLATEELQRLIELEKSLNSRADHLRGQISSVASQISESEVQARTTRTIEELETEQKILQSQYDDEQRKYVDAFASLSGQTTLRQKSSDLIAQISAARKVRRPWELLCHLIGSADGNSFRQYAQSLTFAGLVLQANLQLEKLTNRYRLSNQDLELQIIDTFFGDARASVKNLSGGEKFLASLALALGLAQVVGQKHCMETLFIDEGFGALDPVTLETAINALCNLQQQGKLIGIISHVDRVKERLPARIELEPVGNGFSTLNGPGCTRQT